MFTEQINRGAGGNCKGRGTVHLTPTDRGALDYRFSGGGVTSTGSLVPASGKALTAIFRAAGLDLGGDCSTTTTGEVAETICRAEPR